MTLQNLQLGRRRGAGPSAPLMQALSDPQTLKHASRGSQTLRGLVWVPVFSSDLGEGAVGSGETLGGSEARGPSSATRGGTPAARSAGVGCHVCNTSGQAALWGFLILQRSLGLSNIGRIMPFGGVSLYF